MKKPLLIVILSVCLAGLSLANSTTFSFKLDNSEINVRAPNGFYDASSVNPEFLKFIKTFYPETFDIHTVLVPKPPFDKEGRYIILLTLSGFDGRNATGKQFDNLRDFMREQQYTFMSEMGEDAKKFIESGVSSVNDKYDEKYNLIVNEITPLGVFIDNSKSLSFSAIMSRDETKNGNTVRALQVASTTYLHIKNKLLVSYLYSDFNSEKDLVWLKAKTQELIGLLLKYNK